MEFRNFGFVTGSHYMPSFSVHNDSVRTVGGIAFRRNLEFMEFLEFHVERNSSMVTWLHSFFMVKKAIIQI